MLDSRFDYQYSLNMFKPFYIDAVKYGSFDKSTSTYSFNPATPYFLNNGYSHFIASSLTMKVNSNLPTKIVIEGIEDDDAKVITQTISNIGKTRVSNFTYELEEHNHEL